MIKLTQEQLKQIQNFYPKLHCSIQNLEDVVRPELLKDLKTMQDTLNTIFADEEAKEEQKFNKNFKELSKIAEQYKLNSICVYILFSFSSPILLTSL